MKQMACYVYTYNHIIFINVLCALMTIYVYRTNCDAVNALPFKWHIYRNFPAHCPLLFMRPKGGWWGMKWGELSQSPFNIWLISNENPMRACMRRIRQRGHQPSNAGSNSRGQHYNTIYSIASIFHGGPGFCLKPIAFIVFFFVLLLAIKKPEYMEISSSDSSFSFHLYLLLDIFFWGSLVFIFFFFVMLSYSYSCCHIDWFLLLQPKWR